MSTNITVQGRLNASDGIFMKDPALGTAITEELFMRQKALISGLIWVGLSLLVLPVVLRAKSSNSTVNAKQEAELEPCCGNPEPEAEGEAQLKAQMQQGVVKDKRFTARVEIPIPNALGIDEANANTADIRLILSRAGVDYAECRLVFTEIEEEPEDATVETEAEYKVDIRLKKGAVQSVMGSCVVDPVNNTAGLPEVQAGDSALAILVVDPADRTLDIDFLQGTFGLD